MTEKFDLKEPLKELTVEVELPVYLNLLAMARFKQLTESQITNLALKAFIRSHKDYFPADNPKKRMS